MAEQSEQQQKFAVLIDGDNAQAALLSQILAEVSKFGQITIKRIYGDWTTTNMNSWKSYLHKYAIQPMQQFRYTVGKNATDSALIIDAMDILHSHDVDGFCIVSSDSDYTRLATRISEEGLFVIGVGEKKTPEAFTNACNQFIYCENLVPTKEPKKRPVRRRRKKEDTKSDKEDNKPETDTSDPLPLLLEGFELAAKEDDWVHLAALGSALRKLYPAFDTRTYHHQKLQSLIEDYPDIFTLKLDDSKTPPVSFVALTTTVKKEIIQGYL